MICSLIRRIRKRKKEKRNMEVRFYRCSACGQITAKVKNTDVPLVCCGKEMKEIRPNTVDATIEKHVPDYDVENGTVTVWVGLIPHPMTEDHYIEWVMLETDKGNQRKELKPDTDPKVCFRICEDENVKAVYAYCNIHSLWKA